jgi:hypothetical protein
MTDAPIVVPYTLGCRCLPCRVLGAIAAEPVKLGALMTALGQICAGVTHTLTQPERIEAAEVFAASQMAEYARLSREPAQPQPWPPRSPTVN